MAKPTIAQLQQRTTDVFTAYNDHDADRLMTYWTDDIVLRQGQTVLRGKDEVGAQIRELFAAFPDAEWPMDKVEMMISPDHRTLSLAYVFRGTQEGNYLGIPGTGRFIEFEGLTLARLAGLATRELTMHMDTYGYLVQLGVLPGPTALGFKAIALAEISLNKARQVLRV